MKRFFEVFPAALAIFTLILPLILVFFAPSAAAFFLLIFSIIWFVRAIEFSGFLIFSFSKFRAAARQNWRKKIADFDAGENLTATELKLRNELKNGGEFLRSNELRHLVIVPTFREPIEVLLD